MPWACGTFDAPLIPSSADGCWGPSSPCPSHAETRAMSSKEEVGQSTSAVDGSGQETDLCAPTKTCGHPPPPHRSYLTRPAFPSPCICSSRYCLPKNSARRTTTLKKNGCHMEQMRGERTPSVKKDQERIEPGATSGCEDAFTSPQASQRAKILTADNVCWWES